MKYKEKLHYSIKVKNLMFKVDLKNELLRDNQRQGQENSGIRDRQRRNFLE